MIKNLLEKFTKRSFDNSDFKLYPYIKGAFHAEISVSYMSDDTDYDIYAIKVFIYRLMKGIYDNGYSTVKINKANTLYHTLKGYGITLFDGKYPFFLDPLNILIVTISSSDKIGVLSDDICSKWYLIIVFDFYGKDAAKYQYKYNNAIDKISNIYKERDKVISNRVISIIDDGDIRRNFGQMHITFDNIVLSNKELIKATLDVFIKSKGIYNKLGISYRLGILLYGKPGTGKTTLAKAISSYTKFDLVYIRRDGILNMYRYRNSVLLIEEIDKEVMEYKNENGKLTVVSNPYVLKNLLTSIDMVDQSCIIIATTNHIEYLDEALVRDGRFDMKIRLDGFTRKDAEEMCIKYGINPEEVLYENDEPGKLYNPSILQNQLKRIVNINEIEAMLEKNVNWKGTNRS